MNAQPESAPTDEPTHNRALATSERFAAQLLRQAIDALASQRTLWPVTPQQQQQEIIDRLRNGFTDVILRQIPQIAAAGFVHAEVSLQTITAKGDAIKAVVTIGDNKTLHDLVDVMGRKVVLVLVDAEVYAAGMESFEAQKDQPELPLGGFEAGQEAA
jgi:Tfp pilus assembly protein PilN